MGRSKHTTVFGFTNMKRCLLTALASVALLPVVLLLGVAEPDTMEPYQIPVAFFSILSGAFAFLFYQIIQNKSKSYYNIVQFAYIGFVLLSMSYLAEQNPVFYYAGVLVVGLTVYLSLSQYALLVLGELFCYGLIMVRTGVEELALSQVLVLTGVHLLVFIFSRDAYTTKKALILEERKLRRKMQEAERDPLTGLMNRRGLERHVAEVWESCVRNKEMVSVFVMDIDLFKSYNDRFGHVQGDRCIQKIAHSIETTVGNRGIAARIGGEEFLVFVRGESVQEIHALAEQIRSNVEQLRVSRGTHGDAPVTISVGVDARYASGEISLESMYGRADQQLYQAKQEGRNCVRSTQMARRNIYKIV